MQSVDDYYLFCSQTSKECKEVSICQDECFAKLACRRRSYSLPDKVKDAKYTEKDCVERLAGKGQRSGTFLFSAFYTSFFPNVVHQV
jgi:hypothetical protein